MQQFKFGEVKVSWIELFFDLVFVATAHEVATLLKDTTSFWSALPIIGLFLAILWVWLAHTLFSARFDARGWVYHIMTFLTMSGVFGLVVMLGDVSTHFKWFAWLYGATRLFTVLLYIFALLRNPFKVLHLLPLLLGFITASVLWIISPLTPYPYVVWGLALLIDMLAPLYSAKLLARVQIHTAHLPERLGLLTVIMLGEMIIAMVASSHKVLLTQNTISILGIGMLTIGMIFWTYFRFVERDIIGSDLFVNNNQYIYTHLPLFLSLVCLAAGFKASIISDHIAWLIILGIILFILSFRAIKNVTEGYIPIRQLIWFNIYGAATLVYLIFSEPSFMQVIVVVGLFIVYLFVAELFLTIFKENRVVQKNVGFTWDQ